MNKQNIFKKVVMKYKNLRKTQKKKIQIKIFKSSRTIVKIYAQSFFYWIRFQLLTLQFETLIMMVSRWNLRNIYYNCFVRKTYRFPDVNINFKCSQLSLIIHRWFGHIWLTWINLENKKKIRNNIVMLTLVNLSWQMSRVWDLELLLLLLFIVSMIVVLKSISQESQVIIYCELLDELRHLI